MAQEKQEAGLPLHDFPLTLTWRMRVDLNATEVDPRILLSSGGFGSGRHIRRPFHPFTHDFQERTLTTYSNSRSQDVAKSRGRIKTGMVRIKIKMLTRSVRFSCVKIDLIKDEVKAQPTQLRLTKLRPTPGFKVESRRLSSEHQRTWRCWSGDVRT